MALLLDTDAIEQQAQTATVSEMVAYLQEHLNTAGLVYVAGLSDAKMLGRWRAGAKPHAKTRLRLQHAYHAALLVVTAYDADTAQGWFFGSNSKLDDEAPARVLRNAQSLDDLRLVVPAAKGFSRARE